jgi:glycosyltransferase involved in cell wall biosynthesis
MKILLTCHQFFPRYYHGTERYTFDLAKSLQILGHEVVVLTTSRLVEDSQDSPWYEHNFEGVRVICIDLIFAQFEDFSASYTRPDLNAVFADILCQEKPDLIHCCHLLYLGTDFLSVAAVSGVPIFMTFTDFFGICWTNRLQTCQNQVCSGPETDDLNCIQDVLQTLKRPFKRKLFNFFFSLLPRTRLGTRVVQSLVRKNILTSSPLRTTLRGIEQRRPCISEHYRHIDRFFVATSYLRDSYVRAGYDVGKFRLLYFGITQPDGEMMRRMRERYEDLSTGKRPLVIGFIGQIDKHKGILDLLNAYESCQLSNSELHLYGDVKQNAKVTGIVEQHARQNLSIKLCGTFPGTEIYQRLSTIDILVLPSTWAENSPLVLLNALASRTMVVLSDVKGMAEFISDGINGRLIRPGDVKNLAETLSALAADRVNLLKWFDESSRAYETSPLDYAREIELEYFAKLRAKPNPGCYAREFFPAHPVNFITVALHRIPEPTENSAPCHLAWSTLPSNAIAIEAGPDFTSLKLNSPQSHLLLSPQGNPGKEESWEFNVKWPQNGLSLFYYTTQCRPDFCEEQKICLRVVAAQWYRLSIKLTPAEKSVTRLRWDPLFQGENNVISVGPISIPASNHSKNQPQNPPTLDS